jgi:hypothetical protein
MEFQAVEYLIPYLDAMSESNPLRTPFNLFLYQHTLREGNPDQCIPEFSDPRDDIMARLNELMFRLGVHYGSVASQAELDSYLDEGVSISNNITGVTISSVNVFKTDFAYFAGAAIIELFTIIVILFTFWGWWNLGRDFSFSPLEIGKVEISLVISGVRRAANQY